MLRRKRFRQPGRNIGKRGRLQKKRSLTLSQAKLIFKQVKVMKRTLGKKKSTKILRRGIIST